MIKFNKYLLLGLITTDFLCDKAEVSSFICQFSCLSVFAEEIAKVVTKSDGSSRTIYIEDFYDHAARALFLRYPNLKSTDVVLPEAKKQTFKRVFYNLTAFFSVMSPIFLVGILTGILSNKVNREKVFRSMSRDKMFGIFIRKYIPLQIIGTILFFYFLDKDERLRALENASKDWTDILGRVGLDAMFDAFSEGAMITSRDPKVARRLEVLFGCVKLDGKYFQDVAFSRKNDATVFYDWQMIIFDYYQFLVNRSNGLPVVKN